MAAPEPSPIPVASARAPSQAVSPAGAPPSPTTAAVDRPGPAAAPSAATPGAPAGAPSGEAGASGRGPATDAVRVGAEDAPGAEGSTTGKGTGAGSGDLALLGSSRPGAIPAEYDAYVRALRRRIQERLEYPGLAQRRGVQGAVELELHVGGDGRVAEVRAEGPELLREAAIRAVRDAGPFPFPPDLTPRPLRIRLPVRFELR